MNYDKIHVIAYAFEESKFRFFLKSTRYTSIEYSKYQYRYFSTCIAHPYHTIYVKSYKGEKLSWFSWIFDNHKCFIIENFPWILVPSTNYTKHGTTWS